MQGKSTEDDPLTAHTYEDIETVLCGMWGVLLQEMPLMDKWIVKDVQR